MVDVGYGVAKAGLPLIISALDMSFATKRLALEDNGFASTELDDLLA